MSLERLVKLFSPVNSELVYKVPETVATPITLIKTTGLLTAVVSMFYELTGDNSGNWGTIGLIGTGIYVGGMVLDYLAQRRQDRLYKEFNEKFKLDKHLGPLNERHPYDTID